MTYLELRNLVAGALHRTDLAAELPGFVDRARLKINNDLRTVEQERNAGAAVTDNIAPLPPDLLELRQVSSDGRPLRYVGLHEVDLWWRSGRARVYSLHGAELIVPGADNVELSYIGAEAPFLADGEQRATLTAYPHIWLSACMIEAGLFLRDQGLVETWAAQYQAGVEAANRASRRRRVVQPGLVLSDAVIAWGEARN
jgi:hypothetical protein